MRKPGVPAGKQIVVEGKGGIGLDDLEGKAAVSIGGDVVRVLGPGDHFGEMALLVGTARSATVTADTYLRTLKAPRCGTSRPSCSETSTRSVVLPQMLAVRRSAN